MAPNLTYVHEFKFLLILILLILGWQVSILFIYKYFKLRDKKIKLNRVLLSYGFLTLMGMFCLLFLTLITLFIPEPEVSELLRKLAYSSAFIALFFFWYFVSIKQFNDLVNVKITRTFMVLSIIPIILIIFMETTSDEFRYILLLIIIEGVFLTVFQVKLLQNSKGTVKRRFEIMFAAAILVAVSVASGTNTALSVLVLPVEIYDFLFYGAFVSMLGGFVLILISLYDFPPILEFTWQENIEKLVIFNQNDQTSLFSIDFQEKNKKHQEEEKDEYYNPLFSGGLSGIDSIISAITDTKEEKIRKIKQGNSYILLEYGSQYEQVPLTFAIVTSENLKSIRFFLATVKDQFEAFYRNILLELKGLKGETELLFKSFEMIIKNLLTVM